MPSAFSRIPLKRVQEYWDQRPCNIRHSPAEPGSRAYFDQVEARKYKVEPHIPRFAQFERWQGKKVLEIGCGIGTDTINFARAGAEVTAVDLSAESLRMAEKRARVYGLHNIGFYQGNAEELSQVVPPQEYDLVYSFGVVHHTPLPQRVVQEVRRHFLGPGGTFKIMVYHRASWKVLWILLTYGRGRLWRLSELVASHSEAQTGCPVTYTYTRRSIAQLLAGFQIQEIFIDHIFPYRIADYINYRYRKVWYFDIMPSKAFRWLERHMGWHLCVTAAVPL